jgi:hypothetical protein
MIIDKQSSVSLYCFYSMNAENIMQNVVGNDHGIRIKIIWKVFLFKTDIWEM